MIKVELLTPRQQAAKLILGAIPEGARLTQGEVLRKLSRTKLARGVVLGALSELLEQKELLVIKVQGDILKLEAPKNFYVRWFVYQQVKRQSDLDLNNKNIQALIQYEGIYPPPITYFAHRNMPANWQQVTVLVHNGQVVMSGSVLEVAARYKAFIKEGKGGMLIHRLGTRVEEPTKLLQRLRRVIPQGKKR